MWHGKCTLLKGPISTESSSAKSELHPFSEFNYSLRGQLYFILTDLSEDKRSILLHEDKEEGEGANCSSN